MDVRVCSLPSDSLGSILLRLKDGLHFLAGEVGHLHTGESSSLKFIDDDDDETDCKEEEDSRDDRCLPNRVIIALRCHFAVGLSVNVVAAGVVRVTVQIVTCHHPCQTLILYLH